MPAERLVIGRACLGYAGNRDAVQYLLDGREGTLENHGTDITDS